MIMTTKKCYIVNMEGIAPCKVQVKTWAEDENEALKNLDNAQLCTLVQKPEVSLSHMKRKKVAIKEFNTSLVKLVKNY